MPRQAGVLPHRQCHNALPVSYEGGGGGTGAGTTTGLLYYPTLNQDVGARTTVAPASAYDGDTATYASVSGRATGSFNGADPIEAPGDFIVQGFSPIYLTGISTLSSLVSTSAFGIPAPFGTLELNVTINGVTKTPVTITNGHDDHHVRVVRFGEYTTE